MPRTHTIEQIMQRREYARAYYQRNREKLLSYQKQYHDEHKAHDLLYAKRYWQHIRKPALAEINGVEISSRWLKEPQEVVARPPRPAKERAPRPRRVRYHEPAQVESKPTVQALPPVLLDWSAL